MYRTNKFIAEVWENDYETSLLRDFGIVKYFKRKNQKIYFKYTNPFELLKLDVPKISNNFINSFNNDIKSTDSETVRAAYGIKYLSEELLTNSITSPICLYYSNNEYALTKGNKKLQAAALINLTAHPTIIVTEETYIDDAYLIENDYHLYNILQMLDPSASTFYIRIEYKTVPTFHFLVNERHSSSWINHKTCHEFYQANSLKFPLKVGFLGLASTDDKNIHAIKLNNTIESISGIDITHSEMQKQHLNYFCTVFSKKSINITTAYIEFVRINLFLKSTIQFGYTHTLDNFSKNDILIKFNSGISGKIANIK